MDVHRYAFMPLCIHKDSYNRACSPYANARSSAIHADTKSNRPCSNTSSYT